MKIATKTDANVTRLSQHAVPTAASTPQPPPPLPLASPAALTVSDHRHRGAAVSAEAVTAIPCVTQFSDYTLDTTRQLRGGSEIFTSNFKRRTSDERIKSKAVF
ncbi:hypothetical protein J6590_078793 [Homalodisca vitripennis]|nr:hypothetical protein J6590_078793 [Homalodisca vitripennis]